MNGAWKPRVGSRIDLDDGTSLVLLDMLDAPPEVPQADVENNLYRVDPKGGNIWQVSGAGAVYPRSPFSGMALDDNGNLVAYKWDGGQFRINMETGFAEPVQLAR